MIPALGRPTSFGWLADPTLRQLSSVSLAPQGRGKACGRQSSKYQAETMAIQCAFDPIITFARDDASVLPTRSGGAQG